MKNLFVALALFVSLIIFGFFVITRSIEAQSNDLLPQLLELPAPPPPNPLVPRYSETRSEEFYSKKNPPADNAPIDELLDYWKRQSNQYQDLRFTPELSDRSLNRLLDEIEKNPEKADELLNILPDKPEVVEMLKRIYDQIPDSSGEEEDSNYYRKLQFKSWLRSHSPYFSDELLAEAEAVGDTSVGYVSNHESLLTLARVDFNKAKAILDRLYNDSSQPISQTLARWAFYRHALDTDSLGDIERYRDELQKVVENKSLTDGNRDLAMDALAKEKGWSGRDNWYYGLLEDETLADLKVNGTTYTGLTTLMLMSPPDTYVNKMIELVKSGNVTVRSAAVRNLGTMIDDKNTEVVKALLPWLENKKWANEYSGERQRLVSALANIEIPESVPGLVNLLDEKEMREIPDYSSVSNMAMTSNMSTGNSNRMAVIAPSSTKTTEYYPYRASAVLALAKQKNPQAVPALRRILPIADLYERGSIVRAIYLSNGFSISEQVSALEFSAQSVKETIQNEIVANKAKFIEEEYSKLEEPTEPPPVITTVMATNSAYSANQPPKPITAQEIKELLGQQIIANPEPSPELLAAVVQRINILDRSDRMLADALRRIMLGWQGTAVNLVFLNDVKMGKADINAVLKLLSVRKELREKQINDVYAIRSGGTSFALGLSACLLETQADFDALLVSENQEAKAVLFGCARLIRAQLPVQIVAQNLSSPNKTLALAAESYLESEDSPQARQIILAKYPNQAKILGATTHFGKTKGASANEYITALFQSVNNYMWFYHYYLDSDYQNIEKIEKKLQKEIIASPEILGIYAYDKNIIRIYQDRILFSFAEDESRYRERYMAPAEFDNLKDYLIANRVDEQLPFLTECSEEGCEDKELLMLGRQGGRRIYSRGYDTSEFFKGLDKMFEEMQKAPAKLRYELEKSVAGLEILYADDNLKAGTVWKNGNDLRLLLTDTKMRERINEEINKQELEAQAGEEPNYEQIYKMIAELRERRAYDHFSWRRLTNENVSEMTAPPDNFNFPPMRDGLTVRHSPESWKAKTANIEIRADGNGLYKVSGGSVKKIGEGIYTKPIVTPDGKWAIVSKFEAGVGNSLVRVNLLNNREFKVENEDYPQIEPAAAMLSNKKVLIRYVPYEEYYEGEESVDSEDDEISASDGEIYALDVETGAIEKVKGEVRPLASQTFRPLQKSSASADEYWAAISSDKATQVGVYNAKTLTFKPSLTIPDISFNSMNMWVDEAENKVYFVYKGQLLALSLTKK